MTYDFSKIDELDSIDKYSIDEIRVAMLKLKGSYQDIIKKSIIEQQNIWWVDEYCTSSYYRMRKRAYRSLLLFLNAKK